MPTAVEQEGIDFVTQAVHDIRAGIVPDVPDCHDNLPVQRRSRVPNRIKKTFYVDSEVWDLLDQVAKSLGRTQSDLVREGINKVIAEHSLGGDMVEGDAAA